MVSIRCESESCSCQSEVLFHAGTRSFCSEYCASAEADADAACECAHAGCEADAEQTEARDAITGAAENGPR